MQDWVGKVIPSNQCNDWIWPSYQNGICIRKEDEEKRKSGVEIDGLCLGVGIREEPRKKFKWAS